MTKPINFKPKASDQPVIDLLMSSGDYKNASDLVRKAIWQLALEKYGEEIADNVGLQMGLEMAQQLKKNAD